MTLAPPILVSDGTLVPPNLPDHPLLELGVFPLMLAHKMGLFPDPKRLASDLAYGPLKKEFNGECWAEPLVKMGLAPRAVSVAAFKAKLRRMMLRFPGRKIILVGQSQGGLIVKEVPLDPEFTDCIAGVVLAGAPNLGSDVPNRRHMRWSKRFPGVAEMTTGHPSLDELNHRTQTEWPLGVPVLLVGSPDDALVEAKSAFWFQAPKGADIRSCVIGPVCPTEHADKRHLWAPSGLAHLGMCREPSLVAAVRDFRNELTPSTISSPPRRSTPSRRTRRVAA